MNLKGYLVICTVLAGCQQMEKNMDKEIGAIEVVIFKTKEGYSQGQAQAALERLNDLVKGYDGFISRKLSVDENGNWMDLVYWESQDLAVKAAEEVMKVPEAAEIFQVIEETSMQMHHFQPLMAFEN